LKDLPTTVRAFAYRLRHKFACDIECDASEFKRQVIQLLKAELPPGPGLPRTEIVTQAA
jgi:hypothetical protein